MEITVEYLDGTKEVFPETSRPGGSYSTTGKAEAGWFIVEDAWGSKTYIPADTILKVHSNPTRW
jgi:hypothetical protein